MFKKYHEDEQAGQAADLKHHAVEFGSWLQANFHTNSEENDLVWQDVNYWFHETKALFYTTEELYDKWIELEKQL
jgi:hypothetical protein